MEEDLKFELDVDPHFAANFYFIKFQLLHLIIPKWEGGVKGVAASTKVCSDSDDEDVK